MTDIQLTRTRGGLPPRPRAGEASGKRVAGDICPQSREDVEGRVFTDRCAATELREKCATFRQSGWYGPGELYVEDRWAEDVL